MKLIAFAFGVCGSLMLLLSACNLPGGTSSGITNSSPATASIDDGVLDGVPRVIDPNGPERSWKSGSTYDLAWDVGDAGTNVKVELLKNEAPYLVIAKSVFNSGGMKWKIPTSVAPGTDYKIRVSGVVEQDMTDKSDEDFSIK